MQSGVFTHSELWRRFDTVDHSDILCRREQICEKLIVFNILLDRALPSEGRGQRFESSRVRHYSQGPSFKSLIFRHFDVWWQEVRTKLWSTVTPNLINRNGIYHYIRRVTLDLHERFTKDRLIIYLFDFSTTRSTKISPKFFTRNAEVLSVDCQWDYNTIQYYPSAILSLTLAWLGVKLFLAYYLLLVINVPEPSPLPEKPSSHT